MNRASGAQHRMVDDEARARGLANVQFRPCQAQALDYFLRTKIDVLVLGEWG